MSGRRVWQQLTIGRQAAKLVGIALSLRCEPAGGVPPEDRGLSRIPQQRCATFCGPSLSQEQLVTNPFGDDSFESWSDCRPGRIAGALLGLEAKLRKGPISPTESASFQPQGSGGGKLRVPVGLAQAGHDERANRSGGMRPFKANLTASLPRGSAGSTTASHLAPDVN